MKRTTTTPPAGTMDTVRAAHKARKRRETLTAYRNAALLIICIFCGIFCGYIEAQAGTVRAHHAAHISRRDARKIDDFCRTAYGPGYKIIIAPAETVTDKELQTRAGKQIVYIDQYQTTSRGKYGIVTTPGPFHGDRIRYAAPTKRGRKVTVYLIYDPDTNSTDEVSAIISAGKIRQ